MTFDARPVVLKIHGFVQRARSRIATASSSPKTTTSTT